MEFTISGEFKGFEVSIRREEGKVSPKDINNWTRIERARGGIGERKMG